MPEIDTVMIVAVLDRCGRKKFVVWCFVKKISNKAVRVFFIFMMRGCSAFR